MALTQTYFGNTLSQYLSFFGIIVLSIIIGRVSYYLFRGTFRRITKKTKTEFDDVIIDAVKGQIVFLIIAFGFYLGYHQLTLSPTALSVFSNIFRILIIIDIAWFGIRFIDSMMVFYLAPLAKKTETELDDVLIPLLRKLIKATIIILTIIIILSNFGYDIASILAGLGIGGLAIALAAKDILGNFFGGIMILMDRPFKLNDRIRTENIEGKVREIGLRTTKIKTPNGEVITIPNSVFVQNPIMNYYGRRSRRVKMILGLTYDTSNKKMQKAIKIIQDVLSSVEEIRDNFQVHFTELADYSLNLEVRYWVKAVTNRGLRDVKHQVNFRIKEKFEKAKIELAFPTQTIELKK